MSKIYDSDYSVRLATLGAMGGNTTKCYNSTYEIDLEILKIIQEGGTGGGAQIDDNTISTDTVWSSSKIVSELANAGFDVQVVQELPATGEAHTLYFVPSADPKTQNIYDEYLYANNAWEQVGSTAVDMSGYYTKTEADERFNPKNTVTANSDSYKFPNWNANGQITGYSTQAYQVEQSINGSSRTLYSTSSSSLPTIYAPTTAGTAGYYLVSNGSGAPIWKALEIASDYVISDTDASAGTYSSDIANFYSKTISENIVQGVQIKITDEHIIHNAETNQDETVYSDSYYLPSSSRIYSGNVELWLMTTEDGVSWENIHYLITGESITRTVTTGNFGPVNA